LFIHVCVCDFPNFGFVWSYTSCRCLPCTWVKESWNLTLPTPQIVLKLSHEIMYTTNSKRGHNAHTLLSSLCFHLWVVFVFLFFYLFGAPHLLGWKHTKPPKNCNHKYNLSTINFFGNVWTSHLKLFFLI
jgi:hypothetical protein